MRDRPIPESLSVEPNAQAIWREHQAALHEEINRLPPADRTAIVLCALEGQSPDEVAHQLRWSLARLDRRLARARERLQCRMSRRGFTIPVEELAGEFSPVLDEDLPVRLIEKTIDVATRGRPRGRGGPSDRENRQDEPQPDLPIARDAGPALDGCRSDGSGDEARSDANRPIDVSAVKSESTLRREAP